MGAEVQPTMGVERRRICHAALTRTVILTSLILSEAKGKGRKELQFRSCLTPHIVEVLFDAFNAQSPRNLPKTKAIKSCPPVGMSDLQLGTCIREGILICPNCDERTIDALSSVT